MVKVIRIKDGWAFVKRDGKLSGNFVTFRAIRHYLCEVKGISSDRISIEN